MVSETYGAERDYKITVDPAPSDGKKHPVILLVHGNFGLGPPYGEQIQSFARDLADLGYLTAVPQYYKDDQPHPDDTDPKDQTLVDAVAAVMGHADADADQLGLIGFSLGATTAMTFIATNPPGTVKALADFFGFLTPSNPRWGVPVSAHDSVLYFPSIRAPENEWFTQVLLYWDRVGTILPKNLGHLIPPQN